MQLNRSMSYRIGANDYQVETTEGLKDLKVPAGTQPGEVLKLPFLGVPDINKPSFRGDHHFVVTIEIPKHIRLVLFFSRLKLE